MTEREKIINIIEQNKGCDVNTTANCRECKYSKELENYKDMGCSSLKTADALIAAGIGDVTEHKKIIRHLNTDVVAYRALSKANTLEQIIEGQKSLIDEYKHRAEVAEKALKLASECDELSDAFCEARGGEDCDFRCNICLYNYFLQQAERELAEERKDEKKRT